MTEKELTSLSKFLSLVLRHKPQTIGITLDENGWADVNELITNMQNRGKLIDRELLERIVADNNKKRYSFNDDRTRIRANQGHSLNVDVELNETVPPDVLYHGTAAGNIESIHKQGILKQNRQHVHMSADTQTATAVGKRHGKPVVLEIDAYTMYKDGHKFYLSVNNVWLTEIVPAEYISGWEDF